MTGTTSTAAANSSKTSWQTRAIWTLVAFSLIILAIFGFKTTHTDPYVKATLKVEGSLDRGSQLFRMNCAGCHGIDAQGLVGPSLHEVSYRHSDAQIINQVVKGKTPPMPSFELTSQDMSDLLVHLHSLN